MYAAFIKADLQWPLLNERFLIAGKAGRPVWAKLQGHSLRPMVAARPKTSVRPLRPQRIILELIWVLCWVAWLVAK